MTKSLCSCIILSQWFILCEVENRTLTRLKIKILILASSDHTYITSIWNILLHKRISSTKSNQSIAVNMITKSISTLIVFLLACSDVFAANECPKIVTQKDFDVNKVIIFRYGIFWLFIMNYFHSNTHSILASGMKHIAMKICSNSAIPV